MAFQGGAAPWGGGAGGGGSSSSGKGPQFMAFQPADPLGAGQLGPGPPGGPGGFAPLPPGGPGGFGGPGPGGGGGFGGGSTGFEDEPPLLEELGVDLGGIYRKTMGVLTLRVSGDPLEDSDLGGPVLTVVGLGFLHLLTGKLHFGILLGWSLLASVGLYFLTNILSYPSSALSVHMCCSALGYGLIPQLATAAFRLVLGKGVVLTGACILTVFWSAKTLTNFITARLRAQHISFDEQKLLLFFPSLLTYVLFALLSVY